VVKFVVANDGKAPANNIDLDLYFPEGIQPVREDDFPEEPQPPRVPRRPRGITNVPGLDLPDYRSSFLPPNFPHVVNANYDGEPIVGEDKGSVRFSFSNLKHGFSVTSDRLIFRFLEAASVGAFNIEYCLSADELPDAVGGQLHLRIENTRS
jgi:hypothetical protein